MQPTSEKTFIRLELTPEQRQRVQKFTGRDSVALELTVAELEERITPGRFVNHNESLLIEPLEERVAPKLAGNHNETML